VSATPEDKGDNRWEEATGSYYFLAAPKAKRSREHGLWLVRDGSYFEIVFGTWSGVVPKAPLKYDGPLAASSTVCIHILLARTYLKCFLSVHSIDAQTS
jgi:hypothetical protein